MANVVRLVNGGTIQVRTGVLQGLGPQGPTGPIGPPGPAGPYGPQGEQGPMGQIVQYLSRARASASVVVSPDTDTLAAFGTVHIDDLSCFASSTNLTFNQTGDFLINVQVKFALPANAGDGLRSVFLSSTTNGELSRVQVPAIADDATYLNLSWIHRVAASPETLNVYVRQSDDLSVSLDDAFITIARVGSGVQGPAGPVGATGPQGPTGPAGPQGPAGSSGTGYSTYSDLTTDPTD